MKAGESLGQPAYDMVLAGKLEKCVCYAETFISLLNDVEIDGKRISREAAEAVALRVSDNIMNVFAKMIDKSLNRQLQDVVNTIVAMRPEVCV